MTGKVLRININKDRGVIKNSVKSVDLIEDFGVEGDGHAGDWENQISIFPIEALERVPESMKEEVSRGGYTENFTIEGLSLESLTVAKKLRIGEAEIEIYKIGKDVFKEHDRHYIVSREGRFGKVIKSGKVEIGDKVFII